MLRRVAVVVLLAFLGLVAGFTFGVRSHGYEVGDALPVADCPGFSFPAASARY